MGFIFYNALLALLSPIILLVYGYRLVRGKEVRAHIGERFGIFPRAIADDPRTPRYWVHAVSVGEVMAAVPVLRELRHRHPDALLLLTTTTVGGREVAEKVAGVDYVVSFPLDFAPCVRAALRTVRPSALLLMEWEIWPALLHVAKQHGASVAVINGRVSDAGLRRGISARWLLAPALANVDIFAMQSAEDARRAVLVGAPKSRVHTVGNTKFDEAATMLSAPERAALRRAFGIPDGVPVFICGSTRDAPKGSEPDEEVIIGHALRRLQARGVPGLHVIVTPRHLERVDAVATVLEAFGSVRRRSKNAHEASMNTSEPLPILLLDTFGELARAYAVADVAFVGGSLVRRGGQSVFQPLAQGVPAVFGTFMNNQRDIATLAQAEGVGFMVHDATELADTVYRLLTLAPDEKAALAAKCRAVIEKNQGVTARALDLVDTAIRSNP